MDSVFLQIPFQVVRTFFEVIIHLLPFYYQLQFLLPFADLSALARRSPLNEASVRDVWDIIDASKKFSSIYFASVQRAIWTDPPKSDPW